MKQAFLALGTALLLIVGSVGCKCGSCGAGSCATGSCGAGCCADGSCGIAPPVYGGPPAGPAYGEAPAGPTYAPGPAMPAPSGPVAPMGSGTR